MGLKPSIPHCIMMTPATHRSQHRRRSHAHRPDVHSCKPPHPPWPQPTPAIPARPSIRHSAGLRPAHPGPLPPRVLGPSVPARGDNRPALPSQPALATESGLNFKSREGGTRERDGRPSKNPVRPACSLTALTQLRLPATQMQQTAPTAFSPSARPPAAGLTRPEASVPRPTRGSPFVLATART